MVVKPMIWVVSKLETVREKGKGGRAAVGRIKFK